MTGRSNALNFVRLLLATAVIVGHTAPIAGLAAPSPVIDGLAAVAVNGFFAISGYLIAGSRIRTDFLAYLWRRCLRIFPAFWVVLVVTAVVFAPLSTLFEGRYSPGSAVRYVLVNSTLRIEQWGIAETLGSVPYVGVWNGSLWTLFYEFGAYIVAGLLLTFVLVRQHGALASALALAALTVLAAADVGLAAGRLGSYFAAGALLWFLGHALPVRLWMTIASAGVFAALASIGLHEQLGQLPTAYLLLALGAILPVRIGSLNDISYGVYLYAFPIQQLLAVVGGSSWGYWLFTGSAIVITLPFATLSWFLVERPAMALRHRRWVIFRRKSAAPMEDREQTAVP